MPAPLEGLRVIDAGTRISAPFCAGLLGEMGADVIKVEQPGGGDFLRELGPFVRTDDGEDYSLYWAVEGRGRRSVTCDLRSELGQQCFKSLVATADVLVENFRPGTMEKWGLGPKDLDPQLVYVRISVYGQDGPYSQRGGLDRQGIAFGGLLHLTGYPDRPPVRTGVTISDYLTGVFAAEAALAALYGRDVNDGSGAVVDAPLYGAVLRVLEWTMAAYDRLGTVREREGNQVGHAAPMDNYLARDGRYVCVVAGSDANWKRLCAAIDRPDLLADPRFATPGSRAAHGGELNDIVAAWCLARDAAEVEEICLRHQVPVATAYTAADIAADPHVAARGDLVSVDDPVIGPVRQQASFPRVSTVPLHAPAGAPRLGEHDEEVWGEVLGADAYAAARAAGVIGEGSPR